MDERWFEIFVDKWDEIHELALEVWQTAHIPFEKRKAETYEYWQDCCRTSNVDTYHYILLWEDGNITCEVHSEGCAPAAIEEGLAIGVYCAVGFYDEDWLKYYLTDEEIAEFKAWCEREDIGEFAWRNVKIWNPALYSLAEQEYINYLGGRYFRNKSLLNVEYQIEEMIESIGSLEEDNRVDKRTCNGKKRTSE